MKQVRVMFGLLETVRSRFGSSGRARPSAEGLLDAEARIKDADGKEIMVFTRVNGGLYTADVEIANPAHPDFRRRGA